MTDRELRKLSRRELLELLVEQERELGRLQEELQEAEERTRSREIRISKAGSIAEAALMLSGVFEAAQAAADQYLDNIRRAEDTCIQAYVEAEQHAEMR